MRRVRCWRSVDRDALRSAIADSPLGRQPSLNASADDLFTEYDSVLRTIADRFAPERSVRCRVQKTCPWFDAECRTLRRDCRRLERKYRRTRSADDKAAFTAAVKQKHDAFELKRNRYWSSRIADESCSPSKLWRSISTVLQRDRQSTSTSESINTLDADAFIGFFDDKVKAVRACTEARPPPTFTDAVCSVSLSELLPCSTYEVRRFILQSPTKSCALDPIPTFPLKEVVDVLLPYVTAMLNASLREGYLPASQKHAVVTPLLKKIGLDADDQKNYRPISNLTFMPKLAERVVAARLVSYLQTNNLMPRFQSAYRRHPVSYTHLTLPTKRIV